MKKLITICSVIMMLAGGQAGATMTVTIPPSQGSLVGSPYTVGGSYGWATEEVQGVDMHLTTMAPVDVLVTVGGAGGQYGIGGSLLNNTDRAWTGFQIALFYPDGITPARGVIDWNHWENGDMDITTASWSYLWDYTWDATCNSLHLSARSVQDQVPIGGNMHLGLDIEVIDPSVTSFILRETPIPEPATMTLLGLGALSLIRRKRGA